MIPLRYANNTQLRINARDKAYENMYYNIYKHDMRYDPEGHKDRLGLDDQDIETFQRYYKQNEESELPVKFVTINLPQDYFDEGDQLLHRCLKKCYVGDWHYCFELGEGDHPHYHVYFTSTVKWLAKSRIIAEWSKIFNIGKNFINVKATSKEQIPNLEKYISKEKIFKNSKNKMLDKITDAKKVKSEIKKVRKTSSKKA